MARLYNHLEWLHGWLGIVVSIFFGLFLDSDAHVGAVGVCDCRPVVYRSWLGKRFGRTVVCLAGGRHAIYALAISHKINLLWRLSFLFFRGKVESQRGAMVAPVKTGACSYYVRYPGLPV